MTPRHHLNDPKCILETSNFHYFFYDVQEMCRCSGWSCDLQEIRLIPCQSTSKTIMTHVEFDSFGQDYPLITWVKGVAGMPTGGTPSDHSGGHLSPGGECFAPLWNNHKRKKSDVHKKNLGHSLLKREGVRSTLLQVMQVTTSGKIIKNHDFWKSSMIILDHQKSFILLSNDS